MMFIIYYQDELNRDVDLVHCDNVGTNAHIACSKAPQLVYYTGVHVLILSDGRSRC
jgi:hypothetical protein